MMVRLQDGLTLVEVTIAMAVFSLGLVIISMGFISVVKLHQAGVANRSTQQNARLALDDIMREARAAKNVVVDAPVPPDTTESLCLYSVSGGFKYTVVSQRLYKNTFAVTNPSAPAPACSTVGAGNAALTSGDVKLTGLDFTVIAGPPKTLTSAIIISVNSSNGTECTGADGAFCAVTRLSSTANLRGQ